VARAIDHIALWRCLNHTLKAERAPEHVLEYALNGGLIPGGKVDILMDTEAGVFPATHLLDYLFRDATLCQQKREDLMLPYLEKRLDGEIIGYR
jgi:hypothetical protein